MATAAASSTFVLGCSEPVGDDSGPNSTEDALLGAPLDTTNTWSVGVCASRPNTDPTRGELGACVGPGTRCSGSLVAPNLVMTARHCVEKFDVDTPSASCTQNFAGPKNGEGLRITLASSVLAKNPGWFEVKDYYASDSVAACDNDVVLLLLKKNIETFRAKPIQIDFSGLDLDAPLSPSVKFAIVGRGALALAFDPKTGQPTEYDLGNLERRQLQNIPLLCWSSPTGCSIGEDTASAGQFIHGPGTSAGDSGAALVTQASFAAKWPVAVGVHSITTYAPDGHANAGIAGKLGAHETWMRKAGQTAAAIGHYPVPAWAVGPHIEPGPR